MLLRTPYYNVFPFLTKILNIWLDCILYQSSVIYPQKSLHEQTVLTLKCTCALLTKCVKYKNVIWSIKIVNCAKKTEALSTKIMWKQYPFELHSTANNPIFVSCFIVSNYSKSNQATTQSTMISSICCFTGFIHHFFIWKLLPFIIIESLSASMM